MAFKCLYFVEIDDVIQCINSYEGLKEEIALK